MEGDGRYTEDAGASDWEEQDLLTVDLAAQRLFHEIDRLRREIAAAGSEVDMTEAKARLDQLVAASGRFVLRGDTPQPPGRPAS